MDNAVNDVDEIFLVRAKRFYNMTASTSTACAIQCKGQILVVDVVKGMPNAVTIMILTVIFHRVINATKPPVQHLWSHALNDIVRDGQLELFIWQDVDLRFGGAGDRFHLPVEG